MVLFSCALNYEFPGKCGTSKSRSGSCERLLNQSGSSTVRKKDLIYQLPHLSALMGSECKAVVNVWVTYRVLVLYTFWENEDPYCRLLPAVAKWPQILYHFIVFRIFPVLECGSTPLKIWRNSRVYVLVELKICLHNLKKSLNSLNIFVVFLIVD